uniref:Sugar ABC transporter substrate-binding protein n=1 Tax=Thermosporothrix sp. COM3 TaxID=2490863 RepID=A0A455SY47_9CHLR|nr:sugar ABC transporter substrate-binding protein [Thermosporothrix sp. COM3]
MAVVLLPLLLSACSNRGANPHEVVYWNIFNDDVSGKAVQAVVDSFNKQNPDLHVKMVPVPPNISNSNVTTLITAVRGGTGPDVYFLDRFTVNQYASIGLLEDLNPWVSKEKEKLADQFQPFAWNEVLMQGHPYALPLNADARALFYNKSVLRDAGIDPEILDPKNGPITIDELKALATKINKVGPDGNYERLGMVPYIGEASHTTWGMIYGAKFFDDRSCKITPTEPAMLNAMNMVYDWVKELNPSKVATFVDSYVSNPSMTPAQDPFMNGKLGFKIDGDWALASIAKYKPNLDYGVTYLPVPDKSKAPATWSGGFSLVIPKNAKNPDGAYRFMRYFTGPEGQKIFAQGFGSMPTLKSLMNDKTLFSGKRAFFSELLNYSHSRVPLPVSATLWDELTSAQEKVQYNIGTPEEALQSVYRRVQPQLEQYCPLK